MTDEKRPHPLRNAATYSAVAGIAAIVGTKAGITALADIPVEIQPVVDALVSAGILGGSAAGFVKQGEKKVTPTSSPRNDKGELLVPATIDIPSI